jgi:hypothetical protein
LDNLAWVSGRAIHVEILIVSVTIHGESDDVLVSLQQTLEAAAELVSVVVRLNMACDIGDSTGCFN